MNIDVINSNDSTSNGEHDGLTTVTNSEEDELNRNKIKIYKGFLITKYQKKNKNNELKPQKYIKKEILVSCINSIYRKRIYQRLILRLQSLLSFLLCK